MSSSSMQDHPSYNGAAIGSGAVVATDLKVPENSARHDTSKGTVFHQHNELQTHFRTLLAQISNAVRSDGRTLRTIGMTSCCRQEGVSAVTANLAVEAAKNQRVLLVDANFVNPSIHQIFGLSPTTGLLQTTTGNYRVAQTVLSDSLSSLSVVVAGLPKESDADGHFSKNRFGEFISAARKDFDLVLVDLPAVNTCCDTLDFAGLLDGTVLVIQAERVSWQLGQTTKALLQEAGAELLGVVINQELTRTPQWLGGKR